MKSEIKNKGLKKRVIELSYKYKLSHVGSVLTALDIIEEIYSTKWADEKFVLSSGHAHLAHLVVREAYLDNAFEVEPLLEKYGIHCDRQAGCDVSTGSLGQGLPISCGIALADRSKNTHVLCSDGEFQEGSIYETLEIAHQEKLDNLKVYINCNGWGAYKPLNSNHIIDRCRAFTNVNITFRQTDLIGWPGWLQAQNAHYVVMDEVMYKQAMEVLE